MVRQGGWPRAGSAPGVHAQPCVTMAFMLSLNAPTRGEVVTVRFDDVERSVWWGPDGDIERVAVESGRVLTWATAGACEAHARQHGWVGLGVDDDGADIGRSTMDFEPAQAWLRGRSHTLDMRSALDLWNFSWDVTASFTGAWPVLTRSAGRCHDKLTAANVPWLFGEDTYRPRWSAAELRSLRQALGNAVHVLRSTMGQRPQR